ncbi:Ubiquitin fusion degradation protein 1 like protein [Nosema granulosis]|uniref:Ubiquitin fusion degradation protein 1 like protein n=1 Tax=Nosema granulosis TaxID=83296 RepID=A0A9P6L0J3_9MICR|nr:Ubiquitin fusion degradation protein 1 like protein [Nosema granulosis]
MPSKYPRENQNNYGGKMLLPQSVLEDLVLMQVQPPYIFEIAHPDGSLRTNCGVLEFTAEETTVIVPNWIYEQLALDMVEEVEIKFKTIPIGSFVKLLPHSTDFLEIENPKVELEQCLRNYQVLTLGDEIQINFEEFSPMRFSVVEIEPSHEDAIYIVDTDLSVDFCEPLGYKEKVESERTVNKYVEIAEEGIEFRAIKMKLLGLSFNLRNL